MAANQKYTIKAPAVSFSPAQTAFNRDAQAALDSLLGNKKDVQERALTGADMVALAEAGVFGSLTGAEMLAALRLLRR